MLANSMFASTGKEGVSPVPFLGTLGNLGEVGEKIVGETRLNRASGTAVCYGVGKSQCKANLID